MVGIYDVDILVWAEHQAGSLRRAMLHLPKPCTGADEPIAHWRAETVGFLADAVARFTPAMRQRIDLHGIYTSACRQAAAAGHAVQTALSQQCP